MLGADDQKKSAIRFDKRSIKQLRSQHFGVKTLSDAEECEFKGILAAQASNMKKCKIEQRALDPSITTTSFPAIVTSSNPQYPSVTQQSAFNSNSIKIRRESRETNPIVTLPTGPNFPPKCRSLQRRGH